MSRGRGLVPVPVMRAVVRATVRPVLRPAVSVPWQRRSLDLLGAVSSMAPRGEHRKEALGGRQTDRLAPTGADDDRAILYLHGGGYVVGSRATHLPLAARLAAAAAAPVHLLDYRRAPDHPFPAALDDAAAAYDELLSRGIESDRIALAGDSAGGGLALALALRIRDTGRPAPAALGLISPWADLTLSGVHDDVRDPMLTVAWLAFCAAAYAGGVDTRDPRLSPLYADLTGLPPTVVHGTEREILLPDIKRLIVRLDQAQVPVTSAVLPRVWHVAHLHAGVVPAASTAVHDFGGFLGRHIGG